MWLCFTFALVPPLIVRNLTPFVSGFSGGGAPRSITDAVVARVVGPSSLGVQRRRLHESRVHRRRRSATSMRLTRLQNYA